MPVFNPLHNLSALSAQLRAVHGLVVVCYCAQWCDTCKKYEADFTQLAGEYPQHVFVWVDIEENPELLGDEDVENFPTVSVQSAQGHRFFGTLMPYINHLARLIDQIETNAGKTTTDGPPLLTSLLAPSAQ
ncbi:MAG: thioredoxin [Candidimonas sp.]|nr:MAG: thioredoxin [Candidimonas sp.]TAM20828.1 MAG: thioredoxin [Candidimonas sp.]TAM80503.1 MAG: thioredoxin [Candidimonas sp.]